MIQLALLFAVFVAICMLCQAVIVSCFVYRVRKYHPVPVNDSVLPKAAIAVAIRGLDPYLADAIQGLLCQDYPDYHVYIVVDSAEDAAWELVKQAQNEATSHLVSVACLTDPRTTCSLKNSALVQILENLDDSYDIVAFLDGDVIPHTRWLRDLVTPLLDPHVGVTTGNRWYAPDCTRWGSCVRYVWNVGAVVQMWLNDMVWAGSMAIKRSVITETNLLNSWAKSLSTDAVLFREIRKHGHQVRFAPSVIMIDRGETSLPSFVTWVQRQLLTARLYHPGWSIVGVARSAHPWHPALWRRLVCLRRCRRQRRVGCTRGAGACSLLGREHRFCDHSGVCCAPRCRTDRTTACTAPSGGRAATAGRRSADQPGLPVCRPGDAANNGVNLAWRSISSRRAARH